MMLERQREGIARPKARLSDGISSTEVAKRLKIERGGVYRAMRLPNIKRQPTSIGAGHPIRCFSQRIGCEPLSPRNRSLNIARRVALPLSPCEA